MRRNFRTVQTVFTALTLIGAIGFSATAIAGDKIEEGKKLAFNKKKGNCLACHHIVGGTQPGNIAPPLVGMKGRFPKKSDLRAQIVDARVKNPDSMMPPFGPHVILTDEEIDSIVEFIYSL